MSAPRSRSGEGRRVAAALALLIVATLLVRLLVAGLSHLSEDEAYYRLWSFAPALGYFDHPPMIAWWAWLGRQVLGDTGLAVRLLPALGCAGSTYFVFDSARLAGATERAALGAAVFFNATLLVGVGGFLAVPDAPASLFWAAALWAALRARHRQAWWLVAGVCAGLAALSKYSTLFLAPGLGLWLISTREGRAVLGRPWPWLGAALALAIFGLNVAWNAQHEWVTFAKQFGRVTRGALAPAYLPEFLLGQALLANPLIALLAARGTAPRGSGMTLAPFLLVSAPFAMYLVIHALHARVEAHWPAPIYGAIAVLAAAGAARATGVWGRIARAAPWLGFGLTLVAFAWMLGPASRLAPPLDPALPIRGWDAFAQGLEIMRKHAGAAWIGTESYGLAAQLADERGIAAPVLELKERDRYRGLRMPKADLSRTGLVVDLGRRMDLAALRRCFGSVESAGVLRRGDAGAASVTYMAAEFPVPGPMSWLPAVRPRPLCGGGGKP